MATRIESVDNQIAESIEVMSRQEKAELIAQMVANGFISADMALRRLGISDISEADLIEKAKKAAFKEYPLECQLDEIDSDDIRKFVHRIMNEDR